MKEDISEKDYYLVNGKIEKISSGRFYLSSTKSAGISTEEFSWTVLNSCRIFKYCTSTTNSIKSLERTTLELKFLEDDRCMLYKIITSLSLTNNGINYRRGHLHLFGHFLAQIAIYIERGSLLESRKQAVYAMNFEANLSEMNRSSIYI